MTISRRSLAVIALVACTSLPAAAQFGGLLGGAKAGPTGGGNIDQDVKIFGDKSNSIEMTLYKASAAIGAAYATEEQRAKLTALNDSIGKATDPKEANAKRAEMIQSAQAIANQNAASEEFEAKTKSLSAEKKMRLAQSVTLLLSSALQAKDLIPSGQSLLSSVASNPLAAGKVMAVKDAMPRLGTAVSFAAESAPKLIKALRGANVKVIEPKSSSEKVADISPEEFGA